MLRSALHDRLGYFLNSFVVRTSSQQHKLSLVTSVASMPVGAVRPSELAALVTS